MADGKSAKDLLAEATVPTLRRNGGTTGSGPGSAGTVLLPTEDDPIDRALHTRKKITAQRILEQTANEVDVETLKARNERLRLEIEAKQLTEQDKTGAPSTSSATWQQYLFEELKSAQEGLRRAEREVLSSQAVALNDRLEMLRAELGRITESAQPALTPAQQLSETLGVVESAKQLVQALTPAAPPPAQQDGAALTAWMHQVDVNFELRKAELELKRQQLAQDQDAKRAAVEADARVKAEHYQRMDRFLEGTMPRLLAIGEQVVAVLQQRTAAGVVEAATAGVSAAGQVSPAAAPPLPPGAQSMVCGRCGAIVIFRPQWPGAFCGRCGAEYAQTPDEPSPPPRGEISFGPPSGEGDAGGA